MSNDGGPAFPVCGVDGVWSCGMTLRDWFAGQALAGICHWQARSPSWGDEVRSAYEIADRMLAERARGGEKP